MRSAVLKRFMDVKLLSLILIANRFEFRHAGVADEVDEFAAGR